MYVLADPYAVSAGPIDQFAVIPAAGTVDIVCNLNLKSFNFNDLNAHSLPFGSSEENRTPILALKEPHPGR